VSQDEAVFGADLDADVAALAPFVNPTDVDEVNESGRAAGFAFGGVDGGRGGFSRSSTVYV
jgi:hypothetical protein